MEFRDRLFLGPRGDLFIETLPARRIQQLDARLR
jgi:hypothetical protein